MSAGEEGTFTLKGDDFDDDDGPPVDSQFQATSGQNGFCVPHQCIPPNYLSSGSNYWGGESESSGRSGLAGAGAGAGALLNRWAQNPWPWAAAAPAQSTLLSSKRTSYSCNDLDKMAKQVNQNAVHSQRSSFER